jgi:hypothetical protein
LEERPSFLKKRSKRLLFFGVDASQATRTDVQKFFGSFFQQRTFFLPWVAPTYLANNAASHGASTFISREAANASSSFCRNPLG